MNVRMLMRGSPILGIAFTVAACSHFKTKVPESSPGVQHASAAEMMAWIGEIERQGMRRPAYAADSWVEDWAKRHFTELGLEQVTLDPIDVVRWEPQSWSLKVWHPGAENAALSIPSYPVPLSANASGLEGELVLSETPSVAREAGKIAVVPLELMHWPEARMKNIATWAHDPTGEFYSLMQTLPMTSRWQDLMDPDIEAGAIGFIGILDFPWETDRYYNPYDGRARSIPGLWLSASHGRQLREFMAQGPTRGRIDLRRELTKAVSHNVIGVLPGRSDEWIIIGSHHDGPWNSAVEDASGIALVLAQAKYWSQVPQQQRPHNLMFLLNGGHMAGGAGLLHFAETRRKFLQEEVVAEIHLEHAAREARGENGELVRTDNPEVRWWFTSFIPKLEEAVASAICAQNLERSLIMPVEGFPSDSSMHPPTDAAFFHPLSPIVSFLTAPMYLFDAKDRSEFVHEESLEPVTRAAIQIIEQLADVSGADLRAGRYTPPRRKKIPSCDELRSGIAH